ncbi:IS3 family transposase, partial [Moraxella porci]
MVGELRQQRYLLSDLLKAAKLARSVFYYHLKQLAKADKHQAIKHEIQNIYHAHKGRYGYRRMTLALKQLGFIINHKKVQRLMHELGFKAVIRRKRSKYSTYRGQIGKIATNVLNRNFKTDKPNHKWATDVTEFKVVDKQGNTKKLYLSPIIDLYNGEIISYNIKDRPTYELVQEMLNQAITTLTEDDKPILHSDQGWHYQMNNY